MRVFRFLLLLPASFLLSFGLVIIANDFQLFSYLRFARLALYLTPAVLILILALSSRFPLPQDLVGSRNFKREAAGFVGITLIISLVVIPVYDGWGRYLITLVIIASSLFIWGTVWALPILSGEASNSPQNQIDQVNNENHVEYSWRKNYPEGILLIFFSLVGIAGLAIFLYMALFVRMYGDDWCYYQYTLTKGVFGAAIDFYLNWSGRFTSNFFLFAGAGSRWTPMIQLILVIGSIFTCCYLALSSFTFSNRLKNLYVLPRIVWSLGCASFLPFLIYSITPDPYKSLYWIVSSVVVLPFVILLPVYLVFANTILFRINKGQPPQISRRGLTGIAFLGFVLGFSLSTIHEVATVPILILGGFFLSMAIYLKARWKSANTRNSVIIMGITLAGSFLGLIVTFFSPGNSVRHLAQGYPQPPDVITLLQLNTQYFLSYLGTFSQDILPSPNNGSWEFGSIKWFGLVSAFTIGYLGARSGRNWWNPVVVFLLTLLMTWSCFLPGTYAAQVEIPMRAELIPTTLLVFGAFLVGFLSPKFQPKYLSVALLSVILLLNIFFFRDLINTQMTLVKPMVAYSQQWDIRNTRLLTSNYEAYSIKPPWDDNEQGMACLSMYYDRIREGVYDK